MPGLFDYGLGSVEYGLDPAAGTPRAPSVVGPGQWIEQPLGSTRAYSAALCDPTSGLPIPVGYYESTAVPSVLVWDGGDGPVLATPAASWASTDHTAIDFTVAASDIAGLEVQPYPIRLLVGDPTVGDDPVAVWDGTLDVQPAPSTGAAIPVYGTYLDILRYSGSRMAQFLTPDQRAGFLADRGEARQWLDGVILAHYRPKYTSYYGVGMAYTYGTGSLFPLGIGSLGYRVAPQAPDPILLTALADDGLMVTPRVTEIVARYAASLVLARQTDAQWQTAALVERARAEALATSLVAQISTTGDSAFNVVVNLSVYDGRDI